MTETPVPIEELAAAREALIIGMVGAMPARRYIARFCRHSSAGSLDW